MRMLRQVYFYSLFQSFNFLSSDCAHVCACLTAYIHHCLYKLQIFLTSLDTLNRKKRNKPTPREEALKLATHQLNKDLQCFDSNVWNVLISSSSTSWSCVLSAVSYHSSRFVAVGDQPTDTQIIIVVFLLVEQHVEASQARADPWMWSRMVGVLLVR